MTVCSYSRGLLIQSVIPELSYRESQVWAVKGRSSIKDFEDDDCGGLRGLLIQLVIHAFFHRHSRVVLSGISGVGSQSRSSIKYFEDDCLWWFEGEVYPARHSHSLLPSFPSCFIGNLRCWLSKEDPR